MRRWRYFVSVPSGQPPPFLPSEYTTPDAGQLARRGAFCALFCSPYLIENMPLIYLSSALQAAFAPHAAQSAAEEKDYAMRLREVENALLCQAFGGQVPQPDGQQRLQRYLNGEISRAEAFQPLGSLAGRWAN